MAEDNFMSWQKYESEVYNLLQMYVPSGSIRKNVKLIGKLSKSSRQIDVLMEDSLYTEKIQIVVECKRYSRKVHVKDVESFIGLVKDVGADKGLMLTNKGYTEGAINRAVNEEMELELDVINFDELKEIQTNIAAVAFMYGYKIFMRPPIGWIVDGYRGFMEGHQITMYQRGLVLSEAIKKKREWLNLDLKGKNCPDTFNFERFIKDLDEFFKERFPSAPISYEFLAIREKEEVALFRILRPDSDVVRFHGFVDFPDCVASIVLFCKPEFQQKNIKKIKWVMATVEVEKYSDLTVAGS